MDKTSVHHAREFVRGLDLRSQVVDGFTLIILVKQQVRGIGVRIDEQVASGDRVSEDHLAPLAHDGSDDVHCPYAAWQTADSREPTAEIAEHHHVFPGALERSHLLLVRLNRGFGDLEQGYC